MLFLFYSVTIFPLNDFLGHALKAVASMCGMSVHLSICLSLEFCSSELPKIGKNQPKLVQNWPK